MLGWASLRLGKIKSIEIHVNVTWLVIFVLLVYWVRSRYIPAAAPLLADGPAWVVSVLAALVLFASVLAHELAHSLVAVRNGLPIRKITLFIFGGIAHMESEPRTPGVEMKMAIAGPLTSVGIAAILAVVRFVIFRTSPRSGPALVVEYAMYANAVLAAFNLLPGYPLDGGRVLRAILWKIKRDFVKATTIAAGAGRLFGLLLVFAGVTLAVAWAMPGFLWLVLVGSFLERLAFLSTRRLLARDRHLFYYERRGTEPSEEA
jgi:Zn-dependent protease